MFHRSKKQEAVAGALREQGPEDAPEPAIGCITHGSLIDSPCDGHGGHPQNVTVKLVLDDRMQMPFRPEDPRDPKTRDPKTSDPNARDPKEPRVREARVREARVRQARGREARVGEARVQELSDLRLFLDLGAAKQRW